MILLVMPYEFYFNTKIKGLGLCYTRKSRKKYSTHTTVIQCK